MIKYIDQAQLSEFKKCLTDIRKNFGKKNTKNIDLSYGVEGNTFRAYRGFTKPPSSIFQEWARPYTEKIIKAQPSAAVSTESNFKKWHSDTAISLSSQWNKAQDKGLSFAHTYKLVDLYIKWLSQFEFQDKSFVAHLTKYASCALDSQTLNKINICYSKCLPISNPRMGDIHNASTYELCQEIIGNFCQSAGATKLEFDFWAWRKGG